MFVETEEIPEADQVLSRVVGGIDYDGVLPWLVSLSSGDRHICGGSLIHPMWVLTAAHCIQWQTKCNPERLGITAGIVGTLAEKSESRQQFRAKQIFVHKEYQRTGRSDAFDIALIRLDSPAVLTNYVDIIPLPAGDNIQLRIKYI